MRYLITGNTGFKGTWLSLILNELGHEVYGLALPAPRQSLYSLVDMESLLGGQIYLDLRNKEGIEEFTLKIKPDFVIHFAAQALVGNSYINPRQTIETNVMGTFNLLEGIKKVDSIKAILIATTDKVYKNKNKKLGYVEEDALGGYDPYSASKAMADILSQSWALSYPEQKIVVVRAGNVIGGGDFSENRLLPDIYRALNEKRMLKVRNKAAVRPWQHVLDCLNGYHKLILGFDSVENAGTWNFGPDPKSFRTVEEVLEFSSKYLNHTFSWESEERENFYETLHLTLDSEKARSILKWSNILNFESTLELTLEWYSFFNEGKSARMLTLNQVRKFLSLK